MARMPPATGPALIILVAFVLPGFVTVLLQERTFKSANDPTPLDRLLRIVMYSVISYLLIAIAAIIFGFDRATILRDYHDYTAQPAQPVWRGVLLVMIPSLLIASATFGWSRFKHRDKVMQSLRLNPRHTEPTAWDHFFPKRRRCFVRVTFADGSRVLGFYGADSFASYSKDGRDLLLEKAPRGQFRRRQSRALATSVGPCRRQLHLLRKLSRRRQHLSRRRATLRNSDTRRFPRPTRFGCPTPAAGAGYSSWKSSASRTS
jgi:hypothetical protein